jgi:hypothetical protein
LPTVSVVLAEELRQQRYRVPQEGSALRLTFVGQRTYFEHCALEHETDRVVPAFVDFRAGADGRNMLSAVRATAPHVVFVFRPEIVPVGLFRELESITIGYLTEPLPRPGGMTHPDLERRRGYLAELDPLNFDRIACFDPMVAPTVEEVSPVWRSFPLPVSDSCYGRVQEWRSPPRSLFVGRSTVHRDLFLDPVKHEFDVIHVAHGITDELLKQFLRDCDIGINLHNHAYPTFENRVSLLMAAGLLVLSEPLTPTHGLEPGLDYVEMLYPWQLRSVIFNVLRHPAAYDRVRARGRMKAEMFRASRVFPRITRDLLADLAAFGTSRPPVPGATVV